MSQVIPIDTNQGLAERFWGLARLMDMAGRDHGDPVSVVRHVLAILDALDRGESGADVSVRTLSFLKLLRQSERDGDFAYASPEQIRGESLDERSLVFSVGVLLFERLTGRHPFGAEGNSPRRVARIRRGELGSGVNYFPTVPAGLRSVLMRAMGPFPEERFASLAELRARLEQFVNDQAPAPRLPGTAPAGSGPTTAPAGASDTEDAVGKTMIVRAPTAFARDLMAAADVHNANVKARRRRQLGTPAPLGLARVMAEAVRPAVEDVHAGTAAARATTETMPEATTEAMPEAMTEAREAPEAMTKAREATTEAMTDAAARASAAAIARASDVIIEPATEVSTIIELTPKAKPTASRARARAPRHIADAPARHDHSHHDGEISRATTTPLPPRQTRPAAEAAEAAEQTTKHTAPPAMDASRPAASPGTSKLVWLGLGAGLAVALMTVVGLVMWPRGNATGASEPPAPVAEPAQPALAVAEPEPEPAVFDAAAGGQRAIELARACFSPAQLEGGVRFRAGLLYPARAGGVSRVYFAPTEEIPASARVCVREKLMGMVASAPPESSLVVDYQFHLTAAGGDADIK